MLRTYATLLLFVTTAALAVEEPVFFPAKNQTTQQMDQDRAACQTWAKEQTQKSDTANTQVKTEGAAIQGGARGAAAGAAIGAAAGNAGKGAAVGAAVGGIARHRQAKRAKAQQQNATGDVYYRNLSACMQGKGYTAH